jgi:WD40 repeat protein
VTPPIRPHPKLTPGERVAASVFHWAAPPQQRVTSKTPEEVEAGPETVKPLAILKGHSGCVTSIAFSPNRDLLASGAVNGKVLIWDFSGKKPGQKAQIEVLHDAIHALAFSPDNKRLAMGSGAHDGFVWLWDVSGSEPNGLAVLQGHQGPVDCLAFSPDGKLLASGGSDKTVRVWDVGGLRFIARAVFKGHTQPVKAVDFAPDNHSLASGSQDCTVRLWNLGRTLWSKERAILQGHEAQINDLSFAGNGTAIASISQDQSIGVWDVTQVQPKEKMWLEGHVGPGRLVAYAPDSRTIVSVSDGHQVILWDALNGGRLREWQLPKALVNSYTFTSDARYVATGSSEGPVSVYRLGEKRTGQTHHGTSRPTDPASS